MSGARSWLETARRAWPLWLSELIGTALLVAVGCSLVILDFGAGSPVAALVPSEGARRALTGFLFGSVGALIALSHVGKVSGAHINPVVTLAFWLLGRMKGGIAAGYVAAQLLGGLLGGIALWAWGAMGASVRYAATTPGSSGPWLATLGETAATFCLVAGLLLFVGHPRLRTWTPGLFPPLYALLVWLEAPLSGASTNPARSLGPGIVAGAMDGWWIYWLGPVLGMLAGVATLKAPFARNLEVCVAKVFHFAHDRFGLFAEGLEKRR
ncbi:MAG TPA: aquaporin [Anaeromyxobacteraceae bacterium]|nr:aquaporin [Anaeromyxobacteraceae bacterium]